MAKHNSPYYQGVPVQLPPAQQAKVQQVQVSMVTHGGPLPDPEILAGYEKVMVGAAERIFKMAETEQHERHLAAYREHRIKSLATLLGQTFAFIMGMAGIIGGVYLLSKDKSLGGFSVFLTSLATLCGVYVYNRRGQQKPSGEEEHGSAQ